MKKNDFMANYHKNSMGINKLFRLILFNSSNSTILSTNFSMLMGFLKNIPFLDLNSKLPEIKINFVTVGL